MTEEGTSRRALIAVLALIAVAVGATLWLPRWWENHLYRQAERIAGVGAQVLPGSMAEARRKIDPGSLSDRVVEAIGRPSLSVRTEGSSTHDIWTYYYADGTMTLNFTDGVIRRIALDFHTPKIPTSARR